VYAFCGTFLFTALLAVLAQSSVRKQFKKMQDEQHQITAEVLGLFEVHGARNQTSSAAAAKLDVAESDFIGDNSNAQLSSRIAQELSHTTARMHQRLIWAALPYAMLMILGSLTVALLEGWSFVDAVYFTLTTATTIGFGDIRPRNRAGKVCVPVYGACACVWCVRVACVLLRVCCVRMRVLSPVLVRRWVVVAFSPAPPPPPPGRCRRLTTNQSPPPPPVPPPAARPCPSRPRTVVLRLLPAPLNHGHRLAGAQDHWHRAGQGGRRDERRYLGH
jgi:hypothetical protein